MTLTDKDRECLINDQTREETRKLLALYNSQVEALNKIRAELSESSDDYYEIEGRYLSRNMKAIHEAINALPRGERFQNLVKQMEDLDVPSVMASSKYPEPELTDEDVGNFMAFDPSDFDEVDDADKNAWWHSNDTQDPVKTCINCGCITYGHRMICCVNPVDDDAFWKSLPSVSRYNFAGGVMTDDEINEFWILASDYQRDMLEKDKRITELENQLSASKIDRNTEPCPPCFDCGLEPDIEPSVVPRVDNKARCNSCESKHIGNDT